MFLKPYRSCVFLYCFIFQLFETVSYVEDEGDIDKPKYFFNWKNKIFKLGSSTESWYFSDLSASILSRLDHDPRRGKMSSGTTWLSTLHSPLSSPFPSFSRRYSSKGCPSPSHETCQEIFLPNRSIEYVGIPIINN